MEPWIWDMTCVPFILLTLFMWGFLVLISRKKKYKDDNPIFLENNSNVPKNAETSKLTQERPVVEEKKNIEIKKKKRIISVLEWINKTPSINMDILRKIGCWILVIYLTFAIYHEDQTIKNIGVFIWFVLGVLTIAIIIVAILILRKRKIDTKNYKGCRIVADCTITTQGGQGFVYESDGEVNLAYCIAVEEPIPYGQDGVVENKTTAGFVVRPALKTTEKERKND